jgi:tRNA pseudouridine38-40 synthase
MARYQARIAYDGTAFRGFQAQPGLRTVEGELRSALATLGRLAEPLLAGGRTDAGVHAAGQVIAFDLDWAHPVGELQRALNALLPDDISCPELAGTADDFHPRYQALQRCYRYRVICVPWPDPLRERYALRVWPAPDAEAMAGAARALPGKKDFGAFGSAPREGSHTVRTILRAEWLPNGDTLEFWIEADAFLFRMVRTITATLLQVGGGRRTGGEFQALLETPPQGSAAPPAPAHGLCLMRIEYPGGKEMPSAQ